MTKRKPPEEAPGGEKPKGGRPSDYTDSLALTICGLIADGQSLRSICRREEFPDKATVLRWLSDARHTVFRDQYTLARDAQADSLVEECLDIADDGSNDWMEREGKSVLDGEHVQRSRLRVDTRKWWAARLAPKKYGDRVATEISGPGGGPVRTIDEAALAKLSDDDIDRLLAIHAKLAPGDGAAGGEDKTKA